MSSNASTSTSVTSKIFVGGIPHGTTSEDLEQYFKNFGKIKRVDLPIHQKTGRGKGFAFVEFEQDDIVKMVLDHGIHHLNGKEIATRKAMESSKASAHTKNMQRRKVFVKGFKKDMEKIEENDLKRFFNQFGQVDRVLIARNSKTGVFRGFVYVIMSTDESVKRLLKNRKSLVYQGCLLKASLSKTVNEVFTNRKTDQKIKNQKRTAFREKVRSQQHETYSNLSVSSEEGSSNEMHFGDNSNCIRSQPLSSKRVIPGNFEQKKNNLWDREERFTKSERKIENQLKDNRPSRFGINNSNNLRQRRGENLITLNQSQRDNYINSRSNSNDFVSPFENVDQPGHFDFPCYSDYSEEYSDESRSMYSNDYAHAPNSHHKRQ